MTGPGKSAKAITPTSEKLPAEGWASWRSEEDDWRQRYEAIGWEEVGANLWVGFIRHRSPSQEVTEEQNFRERRNYTSESAGVRRSNRDSSSLKSLFRKVILSDNE